MAREVRRRLDNLAMAEAALGSNTTPQKQRDGHIGRLQEVFGADFRVLPRLRPQHATELARAFGDSTAVQGNDPLAVVTWLQRLARVRDGAARLDAALMYAEALHSGATLNLTVGQFPYQEGDRWVALPFVANKPLTGGRLALVAHVPEPFDATQPLAGLLIDEWVEAVPNAGEVTGVAFHFDEPGTRAPQAILLAVPPDARPTWDLETLEATVLETLELAKLRAVDPGALDGVGHFLPALYFAQNVEGDTVAVDLTRNAGTNPEGV